jgi:hypothetical protein
VTQKLEEETMSIFSIEKRQELHKSNPNATTVVACGSEWSKTRLYDGWGDCTDEEIEKLTQAVRERFDEIVTENKSSASWIPACSEVIAHLDDADENGNEFDYNAWLEQAFDDVYNNMSDYI